jgi:hypothetical protein
LLTQEFTKDNERRLTRSLDALLGRLTARAARTGFVGEQVEDRKEDD